MERNKITLTSTTSSLIVNFLVGNYQNLEVSSSVSNTRLIRQILLALYHLVHPSDVMLKWCRVDSVNVN